MKYQISLGDSTQLEDYEAGKARELPLGIMKRVGLELGLLGAGTIGWVFKKNSAMKIKLTVVGKN